MQTLVFDTKHKAVTVYSEEPQASKIIHQFVDVPTVKVMEGFYEVMVKQMNGDTENRVPVARFPISNTNMLIKN